MSDSELYRLKQLSLEGNNNTPLVSVIIPTYNRADLVCNAIKSVLNQTFKDVEIIIVDDGSTDDTREKIKKFKDKIHYFYQENKGASAAQNKGIELSKGKWISILASDDIWLPRKLELQLEALNRLGDEFGACFADCKFIGTELEDDRAFLRAGLTSQLRFGPITSPLDYILGHYLGLFVQSMLVRKDLVDKGKGFDLTLVVLEDTDLVFRLSLRTKLCFVNEPLVIIDRSQDYKKQRLSSLIEERTDQAFCSMERMYKKWLSILDIEGQDDIRCRIYDCLKLSYYDWIIIKIKRLRWREVMPLIEKLIDIGETYDDLFRTLVSRMLSKMIKLPRELFNRIK